jgi:prepilin-type processing-associated H-X9-DG protein
VSPQRHGKGSNAIFFDGHATLVAGARILDAKLWDDGVYSRQ